MNATTTKSRASSQSQEGAKVTSAPKHDVPSHSGEDLLKLAMPGARLASKAQIVSEVAQTLAEVYDLQNSPDEGSKRIDELSGRAANKLFEAQVAGIISAEEVTGLLGDQFGWRKKGDAKKRAETIAEQSKTPFGYGETVRKRVTRAVKAQAFAKGGEADNFFSRLDQQLVADYLADMRKEGTSVFTLYDDLDAERKAETANDSKPVDATYNPQKVTKIRQKLNEVGSIEAFANKASLIIAWASVVEAIQNITKELAKRPDYDDIVAAIRGTTVTDEAEAA